MRRAATCLFLLVAVALCEGRRYKLDTNGRVVSVGKSRLATKIQKTVQNATTLAPTSTAPLTTDSGNIIIPFTTARPKKRAPKKVTEHLLRKCCKLGTKGGKKGWDCNWDRFTAQRFTNMEHRMKMKFQGRRPSKRTLRYVRHVERYCVKHGLKSVFKKCCEWESYKDTGKYRG